MLLEVIMSERITIRVTADMKAALERFHQEQMTPMRSRQDAFRHIIEDWLIEHGYHQPRSLDQEGVRPTLELVPRPSEVAAPFRP
jgi:hypothetical protein